jgi:23S rRNA A2030 N6-methylase RlmJ
MPLRLDIKRKLVQRSDRVKGVELHPTEPWILANLYSGNVYNLEPRHKFAGEVFRGDGAARAHGEVGGA